MEMNALTAGVARDGIKNRTDIKVLVCGLLSRSDEKLSSSDLIEIVCGVSMANYFELCGAVDELIASGGLVPDENGLLTLGASGQQAADDMWHQLPNTVREKTLAAMRNRCSFKRSERENGFRVEQLEQGCRVHCTINNGSEELMGISFYLPDRSYAKNVRERFYSDPERVYRLVLAQLTGDSTVAPSD